MKDKGVSLSDSITVGIILIVLGMIAIPHVMAGRTKARDALVRTNMHTIQLTAEHFATLANGGYPVQLWTEVQDVCLKCTGDERKIASWLLTPYDAYSLIEDDFINPFISFNNALANDDAAKVSGTVHYFDYGASGNRAQGYSIRGVGEDATRYMSLVLISYR
ncbi:hypothetical protein IIA15_00955 [candidate division TA06 bacterium]|nr:hypothetical protein [candidate division TA06 bacterium]